MISSKREYKKKENYGTQHLEGRAMRKSEKRRLGRTTANKKEEKKTKGKAERDEEGIVNLQKLPRVR